MNRARYFLSMAGLALLAMGVPVRAVTADSGTNAPASSAANAPAKQGGPRLPDNVAKAMRLPEGDARTNALAAAALTWAQKDAVGPLAWLLQTPSPLGGQPWFDVVMTCFETNGAVTANVLVRKGNQEQMRPLFFSWAEEKPAAATAWASKASLPELVRYLVIFTIGEGASKTNPALAQTWAVSLPAQADRIAAIQGAAHQMARQKFDAVAPWIKQLRQRDLIRAAAGAVVSDWKANKLKMGNETDFGVIVGWVGQFPMSLGDQALAAHAPEINPLDPRTAVLWMQPMR